MTSSKTRSRASIQHIQILFPHKSAAVRNQSMARFRYISIQKTLLRTDLFSRLPGDYFAALECECVVTRRSLTRRPNDLVNIQSFFRFRDAFLYPRKHDRVSRKPHDSCSRALSLQHVIRVRDAFIFYYFFSEKK